MSTILRALKKIDQDTLSQEEFQSWPQPTNIKKAVTSRAKNIWLNKKLYGALFITLIIVTVGWIIISQKQLIIAKIFPGSTSTPSKKPAKESLEKIPVFHAKINSPLSESLKPHGKKISRSQKPTNTSALKRGVKELGPNKRSANALKTAGQRKSVKKSLLYASKKTDPTKTVRLARSKSKPPDVKGPEKSSIKNKNTQGVSKLNKRESQLVKNSTVFERLDDTRIKLQAIAWSIDATKRLAVINGHIVREGESVDGFSVSQIRQEDVIVNDGAESWRLEFGLK